MNPTLLQALLIAAGYLTGSVSFAVVVSRLMGLPDPHDYGSGNPGATNVLRTGNRKAALATLAGDIAKGVVAVLVAGALSASHGLDPLTAVLVGLAAFVGHLFPVFHGFKGGKGVATAAGVLLALDWRVGSATLITWILVAALSRYSSLSALVAAVLAPVYWSLFQGVGIGTACVLVMSLLLVHRHRSNIRKLLAGQESRLGSRPGAGRP